MIIKDEKQFLKLPDWKKVHLKLSYSKFVNYRLMTEEQEYIRKQKIHLISAHYGKIDLDDIQNNPSFSLDHAWPKELEKFITPKLLDLFDTDWFCKFGYCYCCSYYSGYNKAHYKTLFAKRSKIKTIPFSGKCCHPMNNLSGVSITGNQEHFVDPKSSCFMWTPLQLYFQIIQTNIVDKLENPEIDYDIDTYIFDLRNVNIWNYFFNKFTESY